MNETKNETKESRAYRLRWWSLVAISVSLLVIVMNGSVMNVALPTVQLKLNATSSQLQWIVSAYTMVIGALLLTSGVLSDRLDRAKFLLIGLVVFGLSSLGTSFSTSANQLITGRVFMAVGAAMITPSTLSIITNIFPDEERGQAIGVWAGLNGFGIALGHIIGGAIVQNLDLKWIFLINVPVVMVALLMCWFLVPDSRDAHPRRLDIVGNVLFLVGIIALIYGLINISSHGWTDLVVLGTIIGSVVLFTLFVLWERRAAQPLIDISSFRSAGFSTSLATIAIWGFGFVGIQYVLTFYMQFAKGYTALQTGVRYLPLAVGLFLGSMLSARLVARLNTKWVTFLGFLGAALMLVFVSFLKAGSPFLQLGTKLFFLSFFLGIVAAPATNMFMGSLPKDKAGVGSALNSVSSWVVGSIGVATMGSILSSNYASNFLKAATSIKGLPTALADKASNSIGMAIGIAKSGKLPSTLASSLVDAARQSFMDSWKIMAIILCVVLAVGAAICLRFMPVSHEVSAQDICEELPLGEL